MKSAKKDTAAAVGVAAVAVGAVAVKHRPKSAKQHAAAAVDADAAAVGALTEKKKPGMIPTKNRNDEKVTLLQKVALKAVRRHGTAILEFGSRATKSLSAKARKNPQRLH